MEALHAKLDAEKKKSEEHMNAILKKAKAAKEALQAKMDAEKNKSEEQKQAILKKAKATKEALQAKLAEEKKKSEEHVNSILKQVNASKAEHALHLVRVAKKIHRFQEETAKKIAAIKKEAEEDEREHEEKMEQLTEKIYNMSMAHNTTKHKLAALVKECKTKLKTLKKEHAAELKLMTNMARSFEKKAKCLICGVVVQTVDETFPDNHIMCEYTPKTMCKNAFEPNELLGKSCVPLISKYCANSKYSFKVNKTPRGVCKSMKMC
jgi:DNA repair exonuclease SbcCD ATPase subunit